MALNYHVHIQFQSMGLDIARCPLVAAAVPLRGVIRGPGVVPTGSPGGTLRVYARVGDELLIGNADMLQTRNCGGRTLPMACIVSDHTTLAGAMDGVVMPFQSVSVSIRARYSRHAGAPPVNLAFLDVQYFHVDSGGGETLIVSRTFSGLTTSYQNFAGSLSLAQTWLVGEKFRVKYRGRLFGFGP